MAATLSAILGAIGSAVSTAGGAAAGAAGTIGGGALSGLGSAATGLGATSLGSALGSAGSTLGALGGSGLGSAGAGALGGMLPAGTSVVGPTAGLTGAEAGLMFPAGAAGPTTIPAAFGGAGGMPSVGTGMMEMINKSAAQGDALMNHPTGTLVKAITGSEKNDPLAGMLDKVLTPSMLMGKPSAPAQGAPGRGPGNLQPTAPTVPSMFKIGPDGMLQYTGGA